MTVDRRRWLETFIKLLFVELSYKLRGLSRVYYCFLWCVFTQVITQTSHCTNNKLFCIINHDANHDAINSPSESDVYPSVNCSFGNEANNNTDTALISLWRPTSSAYTVHYSRRRQIKLSQPVTRACFLSRCFERTVQHGRESWERPA